jgi:hypothetical protein
MYSSSFSLPQFLWSFDLIAVGVVKPHHPDLSSAKLMALPRYALTSSTQRRGLESNYRKHLNRDLRAISVPFMNT